MIRQALEHECKTVIPILYESGPDVFNYFFASGREDVWHYLYMLYNKPGNALSKELIFLEEEEGETREGYGSR